MNRIDIPQFAADNDRLVIAGLSSGDDDVIRAVQQRCVNTFGRKIGLNYFLGLMATLPDRRPELFPELKDFE